MKPKTWLWILGGVGAVYYVAYKTAQATGSAVGDAIEQPFAVRRIQESLAAAGAYRGPVDGQVTPEFGVALAAYASSHPEVWAVLQQRGVSAARQYIQIANIVDPVPAVGT